MPEGIDAELILMMLLALTAQFVGRSWIVGRKQCQWGGELEEKAFDAAGWPVLKLVEVKVSVCWGKKWRGDQLIENNCNLSLS